MRLTIDGEPVELRSLFYNEPPTTEIPIVRREPLPLHLHWLLSSAATLLVVIGLWAVIRGVFG